jgi:hypothetical protein
MNPVEQRIFQALVELEETVRNMPRQNPKPSLLPLFAQIEQLTRQLPAETDPGLLHYLHKRSYEKARLWLEGHGAENVRGRGGG